MQFLPFLVQVILVAICVVAKEPNPNTDITFTCKGGVQGCYVGASFIDPSSVLREHQTIGYCISTQQKKDPKTGATFTDYEIKHANLVKDHNYNCIGTKMKSKICCAYKLTIGTGQPYPGDSHEKGGLPNCFAVL